MQITTKIQVLGIFTSIMGFPLCEFLLLVAEISHCASRQKASTKIKSGIFFAENGKNKNMVLFS